MIEQKYLELINREIDGETSQKEHEKLQEYLSENPEANDLYDDLRSLARSLSQVEEVEPSPNLKKRVLNSLPFKKRVANEKWGFLKLLSGKPVVARRQVFIAYAFLAGLVLGIAIYSLIQGGSNDYDVSQLYGSIISPYSTERLEKGESAEINLDQVSGTLSTKYSKDLLLAQLSLNTQHEIEVVFEFDGNSLSFNGFGTQKTVGNNLSIGKDYFRLTNLGKNRYFIVFNSKGESATPISFKIFSSGALLYQKSLPAGPKPE